MRGGFVILAPLLLVPLQLSGQSVEVRVVEEGTGRPLAGVVVRLEQAGRTLVMGLSGENGRLALRAPASGAYQLRAGRIGYESPAPLELQLSAATLQQVIEMPQAARMLPTLTVSGATRCRTTGSGLPAALWEEVQLALAANRITVEQRLQVVHAVRYERWLTPGRVLLRERVTGTLLTSGQPFVALPPDQLARQGYVTAVGDSVNYAAPDAAALLADAFVQTHCFTVRLAGPTPDLVGLAFDPAPGRDRSDVAGTLWIDRDTRELRYLEYRYTGVDGPAGLGEPGGRIDFQRLPTGTWIVREWSIRMPRAEGRRNVLPGQEPWVLTGWLEHGGRASVTPPRLPHPDLRSVIEGEIYDSLHRTGLAGALVTVDGEPDSVRTDSSGRFVLPIAGRGPRLVRAVHPLLGLVSDNSTQEIQLHPDRATPVRISVPSPARFAATFCPAGAAGAPVLGMASDSAGRPVEQARIRATWFQSIDQLDRKGAVTRSLTVDSGARGLFAFCDLPPGWLIRIELLGERDAVRGRVQVRTGREPVWVDLHI